MSVSNNKSAGFTLIEVIVVLPMMMLVIVGVVGSLVILLTQNAENRTRIDLRDSVERSVSTIEANAQFASSFLPTLDDQMTDPFGPDNSGAPWTHLGTSADSRVLIFRAYATERPQGANTIKQLVYVNSVGCDSTVLTTNPLYQFNMIYFVRNGNLFQRSIPDSTQNLSTLCVGENGFDQMHSCPAGFSNALCVVEDTLLANSVTRFNVTYNTASSTGETDPDSALQAVVDLQVARSVSGKSVSESVIKVITKRNE